MPSNASGAVQLRQLGLRLRRLAAAGDVTPSEALGTGRSLRAQLLAGIREGTKPAVEAAREAAWDQLPKHGGLNEYVATSLLGTYTRLTGLTVGVRIGVRKGDGSHKAYGANKGTIRHPVFASGNQTRDQWRWVEQKVPAGWFDQTLQKAMPAVVVAVTRTMAAVAEEVTRREV